MTPSCSPPWAGARTSGAAARGRRWRSSRRRVRAALDDVIAELSPGRVAVVVCHGVAARAGVASLVGLDQMQALQVLWGLENCHWAVLAEASLVSGAPVPARWRLDAWNLSA